MDLHLDGRSLHLRRLDAEQAVDLARQQSILARHALLSGPVGADERAARAAADDASTVLRAAIGELTALQDGDGRPPAPLDVDLDVDDAITVARPHGELDLATAPRLEQICLEQLDSRIVDVLVVDLSAATFLDSSALAVLVEIRRVCALGGTRFALGGPTPRTRRLLAISRLDTVFDIV